MTNPIRIEINCETGEVIEHELTDAEVAELQAQAEEQAAIEAAAQAEAQLAADKKATVLEALASAAGLTVDEVTSALG